MNVSVLGPLAAVVSGANVVPTAAKPRILLALLGSSAGQITAVEAIVSELWDGAPPASAVTTVQTYVLQVRRLIQAALDQAPDAGRRAAKDVLSTEPGGYRLDLGGGSVDVHEFERCAAQGYTAMQAGDYASASIALRTALAMWRGGALVDVSVGPRLAAQATWLEESRRSVLERRIDADLHLGRHHEVIGELAGLTAQHNTDERLHAQYMVALYRAGRRAQSLCVYGRLRTTLAEELGVDPAPSIARLHYRVLVADPGLDDGASAEHVCRPGVAAV